ncbi:hypothetical protein [Pseudomonas azerbaijanoccidentalis]
MIDARFMQCGPGVGRLLFGYSKTALAQRSGAKTAIAPPVMLKSFQPFSSWQEAPWKPQSAFHPQLEKQRPTTSPLN